MEKHIKFAKELLLLFIDFKQAFDLIWRDGLWHILLHYGVPENIIILIRDMYSHCQPSPNARGIDGGVSDIGGHSSRLFLVTPPLFLNAALSFAETVDSAGIGGKLIGKLAYADYIKKFKSQEHLL